jgi:hypothetical protein
MNRLAGTSGRRLVVCLLAIAWFAAAWVAGAAPAAWTTLSLATRQQFEAYLGKTDEAIRERLASGKSLWVDDLGASERERSYAKLKRNEVLMRRIDVNERAGEVAGGMIHDWEGLVFIPGAKIDDVLQVLQDYNHHATYYGPDVERARIESREGDHFRVYLRFRRHKVVTVVLNTEHEVTYFRDSPTRAHSRSSAVRIAEVADPGTGDEKEKAPGNDNGYLWGMETWWRLEERDGGVYVQNEVVSLTRDIPTGLGWLIEPFITSIPKETLQFTLEATRNAVLRKRSM